MNTLFDKIWDKHVVQKVEDGPTQLYIDRLYCHEVTSPQAFAGLRARGLKCFRPKQIICMPDHNTPTHDQDKPIADPVSKKQVDLLARNCEDFGLTHFAMNTPDNGVVHVVGPEKGFSLPGMTIVCGDSHTSTHGAMGAVAFGIGTSEVEMVMASQCILQQKPKTMRIKINGKLGKGITAKDVALFLMARLTTSGATGYFVEYAGTAIEEMSMEGRLTLCNLSIEMGARGGLVAPDADPVRAHRVLRGARGGQFAVCAGRIVGYAGAPYAAGGTLSPHRRGTTALLGVERVRRIVMAHDPGRCALPLRRFAVRGGAVPVFAGGARLDLGGHRGGAVGDVEPAAVAADHPA